MRRNKRSKAIKKSRGVKERGKEVKMIEDKKTKMNGRKARKNE